MQVNEDEDRRRLKEKLKEATENMHRSTLLSEESDREVNGRALHNRTCRPPFLDPFTTYQHHIAPLHVVLLATLWFARAYELSCLRVYVRFWLR